MGEAIVRRATGRQRHFHFINCRRTITPAKLREGTVVNVSYCSPAFESKYAVKVEVQPP